MAVLAQRATRGRHLQVLRHCARCVRGRIEASARAQLSGQIADYRAGSVPLRVPLTEIRRHAERLGIDSLAQQVYLDPYPKELMLSNPV